MKNRIMAVLVLGLLMLSMLAACAQEEPKSEPITSQKAVQIAVSDAGYALTDVTNAHPHSSEKDGKTIYEIHFNCDGKEFTYLIDAETGEILQKFSVSS